MGRLPDAGNVSSSAIGVPASQTGRQAGRVLAQQVPPHRGDSALSRRMLILLPAKTGRAPLSLRPIASR